MNTTNTVLSHALWSCAEEGVNYDCTEELINQFIRNRMSLGDLNQGPVDQVFVADADVQEWAKEFVKWLATPKFTTIHEAVEYIVTQGVPRAIAKAMINQQHTWENEDNLLCMFDGNDTYAVPQTIGDITITMNTWEDMLELTEQGVLVEGELFYDVNGNLITE